MRRVLGIGLVLTRGKPLLQLLRFQIETDGFRAESNVGDTRYMAVHPARLYAHHACQLADSHVLVFHNATPLTSWGTVERPIKDEGVCTDFLSENSHFLEGTSQNCEVHGKPDGSETEHQLGRTYRTGRRRAGDC